MDDFLVLMGAACTNQVEDAIPVSGQPIGFSAIRLEGNSQYRSNDGKRNLPMVTRFRFSASIRLLQMWFRSLCIVKMGRIEVR